VALDPANLANDVLAFLAERHLATLSLARPDGTIHVTPVGFMWDNNCQLVRVITWTGSMKARLLETGDGGPASVSQHDGGRWLTIEGHAVVVTDAESCAEGVRRYAERYRQPADRPDRAVIEFRATKILGRA